MQRVITSAGSSSGPARGFHREVRDVPRADPLAFLRALEGEPRGFWGRQDRWVAWAGALARIEVLPGSATSRYDEVRSEVQRVLRRLYLDWGSIPFRERPRFFGGFSFEPDARGESVWTGFPSAGFILPRVLLEGRGNEVRLRVGSIMPASSGPVDFASQELFERALSALEGSPGVQRPESDNGDRPTLMPTRPSPGEADDLAGREPWDEAVRSVLREVDAGRVRKTVLARIEDVTFDRSVDAISSLGFLRQENRRAHVYLFEPHPGRVFLGAAPEILAELRRGRFQATAVAGSMPRGASDEEDAEFAQALLESEKDRAEHRWTAEEMAEVLAPRLSGMQLEEEPRVLALARIQHLETSIRGGLEPGAGEDILSLVEALHPTPAVCGRPRDQALELIRASEAFERGWYSGPVGWFDAAGDGDFVPGLRAAVGFGTRWRLYAGAGIVAGSDPAAEWAETALKFEPALRALRSGAGESP